MPADNSYNLVMVVDLDLDDVCMLTSKPCPNILLNNKNHDAPKI